MKNTKFTKIAILILSVALLVGAAFAVSTSATETPTEEEILSNMKVNLEYGDKLYFLCLVDAENLGADADISFTLYKDADCTDMAATVKAEYLAEGDEKLGTKPVYNTGYYADFASFGVSATFMGVDYYVVATNNATGVSGDPVKCSVIKYLLERLYEDEITDIQREHYENTIAYGSTAQKVTDDTKTNVADYCYVGATGGEVLVDGVSVGSSAILAKGETFTLKTTETLAAGNVPLWKDAAGNSYPGAQTITVSASGIYGYTALPMLTFDGMNSVTPNVTVNTSTSSASQVFTTFGDDYASYNKVFKIYNGVLTKNMPTASIVDEKLVFGSDDGSDYIKIYPTYTETDYNHSTFEADITFDCNTGNIGFDLLQSDNSTAVRFSAFVYNASTGYLYMRATNTSGGTGNAVSTYLDTEGDNAHTLNIKVDHYKLDSDIVVAFWFNGTLVYIIDSRLATDETSGNIDSKNTDGVLLSGTRYYPYSGSAAGKETVKTDFSQFAFNTNSSFAGNISFDNIIFTQTVTDEEPPYNTTLQ